MNCAWRFYLFIFIVALSLTNDCVSHCFSCCSAEFLALTSMWHRSMTLDEIKNTETLALSTEQDGTQLPHHGRHRLSTIKCTRTKDSHLGRASRSPLWPRTKTTIGLAAAIEVFIYYCWPPAVVCHRGPPSTRARAGRPQD